MDVALGIRRFLYHRCYTATVERNEENKLNVQYLDVSYCQHTVHCEFIYLQTPGPAWAIFNWSGHSEDGTPPPL